MLVGVDDRNVDAVAQCLFDGETARRGDGVEVDGAEGGRDRGEGVDDSFDAAEVDGDRCGVGVCEADVERGFAFEDGAARRVARVRREGRGPSRR
jgi:hypothetical protein